MIKWFFKKRTIKVILEKELTDWEMNGDDYWAEPGTIVNHIVSNLEYKVKEEIARHVERKMNEGLLDKVSELVIAEFDMKQIYTEVCTEALKNKVREIIFSNKR